MPDIISFGGNLRRNTETGFIEVPVPSQDTERSCTCVSGIDLASFYGFDI